MSAAEAIAAAIEKLERERTASNPTGETWRAADSITGEYSTIRATSALGNDAIVATELTREDAVLAVTLHRTIDPDLEFLRAAAETGISDMVVTNPEQFKGAGAVLYRAAVDLARAILGEEA